MNGAADLLRGTVSWLKTEHGLATIDFASFWLLADGTLVLILGTERIARFTTLIDGVRTYLERDREGAARWLALSAFGLIGMWVFFTLALTSGVWAVVTAVKNFDRPWPGIVALWPFVVPSLCCGAWFTLRGARSQRGQTQNAQLGEALERWIREEQEKRDLPGKLMVGIIGTGVLAAVGLGQVIAWILLGLVFLGASLTLRGLAGLASARRLHVAAAAGGAMLVCMGYAIRMLQ